jgi:hypothetical protein
MYGMVNQAIEAMVTERFGDNAWERVRDRAGVADPVFVTMKQYPDATTYALVGAISEETGTEVPVLLHAFGRYWVEYARRGPWGAMMLSAGNNARELLAALDAMHARIAMNFPQLKPPSFRLLPSTDDEAILEYRSERPGLAPFVVGLVEGVGDLYGERVEAELVEPRAEGADCDRFRVRFLGKGDR